MVIFSLLIFWGFLVRHIKPCSVTYSALRNMKHLFVSCHNYWPPSETGRRLIKRWTSVFHPHLPWCYSLTDRSLNYFHYDFHVPLIAMKKDWFQLIFCMIHSPLWPHVMYYFLYPRECILLMLLVTGTVALCDFIYDNL